MTGPLNPICDELHAEKYRGKNETFEEAMYRISAGLADTEPHRQQLKDILLNQRFMPAGRVQSAIGSPRDVTAYNCFVSGVIEDSMDSIMDKAKEAAETMRKGGGIGYDFSRIRPRGANIVSLKSSASGPVSFMHIFDAVCRTIVSSGHRRGAMMGVLRVDHPDIEEFVRAKQNKGDLTNFNISVGITDEFMKAVINDTDFKLTFEGRVFNVIKARPLWDEIMRANWDWAEPGVLFIDTINKENNLAYTETIEATNPCGEQPLPSYGACLLGSFNLVRYVHDGKFQFDKLRGDIPAVVCAMDNVVDRTSYPLVEQEKEAKSKRRMGLGVTALANALTLMGWDYGTPEAVRVTKKIMKMIRDESYLASVQLAKEKGAFPLYSQEYLDSPYIKRLPQEIQEGIKKHGIRNSHLTSIAPTGTISFTADNVSSGIEPVFDHRLDRTVQTPTGPKIVELKDYVYHYHGLKGRTTDELTPDEHLNMQLACSPYVDSAISKTINVGSGVSFDEFKDIYLKAWKGGAKGCTTFRLAGKRYGILEKKVDEEDIEEGAACFIDPETGQKECS